MNKPKPKAVLPKPDALFDRVVSILEQARGNVVRAVNTNMVLAYWLIGREIVQELQGGEERAGYGEKVIEDLSTRLTERYGKGYSTPVLWSFRQFYLTYSDRAKILFPSGRELADGKKLFPPGRELTPAPIQYPAGTELAVEKKGSPTGSESLQCFSPQLSWSHYRALMRSRAWKRVITTSVRPLPAAGTSGRWNGRFSRFTTNAFSRAASRRRTRLWPVIRY